MSTIIYSVTTASLEQFWRAMNIWNTNPHVVNRRLCGGVPMFLGKLLSTEIDVDSLILQIKAACTEVINSMTGEEVSQILQAANIKLEKTCDVPLSDAGIYISIKNLVPRNSDKFQGCLELSVFDKVHNEAIFMGLKEESKSSNLIPSFPYSFHYEEERKEISLKLKTEDNVENANKEWLKQQLFPKLLKWAETADCESENTGLVTNSLNLIDITKYSQLYQQLKKKYGPEMVKIWPENTDPLKFVYEDVAIATYLLLIWEEESVQKGTPDKCQSFVDLGCGNGLLVHILNSEGHQGIGLDVRKRSIWDLYPSTTKLEVRSITPSAEHLFPDTDWLIGNHSDELTPWIPVIAARSSYNCRFFLLPCCPYEFNGRKYQRVDSSRSQYEDYLHYIYRLCKSCGFKTKADKLRIPSTKRLCFVGFDRSYPEEDTKRMDSEIQNLIDVTGNKGVIGNERHDSSCQEEKKKKWSEEFKPRENVEKVRNCTQLDRGLVEEIVFLVANKLLTKEEVVTVNTGNKERLWNKGGRTSLENLASLLPKEKLKKLKSECGGLQTLLRNHSHIFLVQNGQVELKMPSLQNEPPKKKFRSNSKPHKKNHSTQFSRKQRPCWFNSNHPNGCPLTEVDCLYKH